MTQQVRTPSISYFIELLLGSIAVGNSAPLTIGVGMGSMYSNFWSAGAAGYFCLPTFGNQTEICDSSDRFLMQPKQKCL